MDGERFDALARSLVIGPASRRRVLRALTGGALGAILARWGLAATAAGTCRGDGTSCRHHGECCTDGTCRAGTCRVPPVVPCGACRCRTCSLDLDAGTGRCADCACPTFSDLCARANADDSFRQLARSLDARGYARERGPEALVLRHDGARAMSILLVPYARPDRPTAALMLAYGVDATGGTGARIVGPGQRGRREAGAAARACFNVERCKRDADHEYIAALSDCAENDPSPDIDDGGTGSYFGCAVGGTIDLYIARRRCEEQATPPCPAGQRCIGGQCGCAPISCNTGYRQDPTSCECECIEPCGPLCCTNGGCCTDGTDHRCCGDGVCCLGFQHCCAKGLRCAGDSCSV